MQNRKIHEDLWFQNYDKDEYLELRKAQKELEGETYWVHDIEKITILPLDNPMDAWNRFNSSGNSIPHEILTDTVENCGLMVNFDGREECMRDCAMPSLMSTIDVRGAGLYRPEKAEQAVALTALLTG